jgi:hypothetical protein
MTNAKDELLKVLESKAPILCAQITLGDSGFDDEEDIRTINLRLGYSEQEYAEFLQALNFSYYSGFGGQELFGIVWLQNNAWLERGEYDGSEWWEYKSYPEVPVELYPDGL